MEFELVRSVPDDVDLVVEVVTKQTVPDDPMVRTAGFEGEDGQSLLLPGRLLVGCDDDDSSQRRAAAIAARAASRCARVATTLPATQAVAEGFALGAYQFTKYRSKPKPNKIEKVWVVGTGAAARAALQRGARVAQAVALARDLVNEPGGSLTAPEFADAIREMASGAGVKAKVLEEAAIKKAGYEGLLAVNRGSDQPPRFVELTYEPSTAARATVALVGKGITFDSGGLSIKPTDGMIGMKGDMGGAAAIVGALSAARDLGVKVRVRAFIPVTDNMLGGDAQRIGDVIRYKNGTTVEVLNTDAEGRLILADGLIAASKEKPAAIVDLATLTGAQVVALGSSVAGVLGNHDGWVEQVRNAGDNAGEPIWPLPLWRAYRRDLDSTIADMKNVGSRSAGTIVAALFLKEFVPDDQPWAHLDIAGPAWADKDDAEISAGGTGFGVRTLLELLRTYKRPA
ncbi:MAG TPA: leucyl aminopeptidase [Acidimicrobiales bacterium]|jgi:leucyl aminopeptidase|nr:leucyl aminopeptidase [Acidimicrobiales bacterium]